MRIVPATLLSAGIGVLAWAGVVPVGARLSAADVAPKVDRIFATFTSATPGCAVGVGVDGAPVLARAYGMADLEHDVPNTPDTIFEAGSVAKQFTAAAVLLLAREGKLSLDDPVRRYIPELPDYGAPLTIRHMLTHTSGLRDWRGLEGIAGWPPTTRAYTDAHMLDIVRRQRSLNFTPGTHWSYSNTGYNLAAVLVSRVAGTTFAEFSRTRLFEPLSMTHTSWRDDHTRIVKHRAIAYDDRGGAFHTDMPFEDVLGNGGLLTTVGDLLKWNENFWSPKVGDAAFLADQQRPVTFSGGSARGYGLGLVIDERRGLRQVDHNGITAGYVAHLARYPDQHVSVAVLCNVRTANPTQRAYDVADLFLAERAILAPLPEPTYTLTPDDFTRLEGVYRSVLDGSVITLVRAAGVLRIEGGATLIPQSSTRFVTSSGQAWEFDGNGHIRARNRVDIVDYERVPAAKPTVQQLQELVGTYVNDETETTVLVTMDRGTLVLTRRPDTKVPLTPVYEDAFDAPGLGSPLASTSVVIVRRDSSGGVVALSVVEDRVWDLRFVRQRPSNFGTAK